MKSEHTAHTKRGLWHLKNYISGMYVFLACFQMRTVWRGMNGYINLINFYLCLSFVSLRPWFSTHTHHWILWAMPWISAYPCGSFSQEHHDIDIFYVVFSDPTFFLIVLASGITDTQLLARHSNPRQNLYKCTSVQVYKWNGHLFHE